MSLLFEKFVLTPELAVRARYVPRSTAVSRMPQAYRQIVIPPENIGHSCAGGLSRGHGLFGTCVSPAALRAWGLDN